MMTMTMMAEGQKARRTRKRRNRVVGGQDADVAVILPDHLLCLHLLARLHRVLSRRSPGKLGKL